MPTTQQIDFKKKLIHMTNRGHSETYNLEGHNIDYTNLALAHLLQGQHPRDPAISQYYICRLPWVER